MAEIKIQGTNRTYLYGADDQGEYGSLLTVDEQELENPDEDQTRLKALAEELEDALFPIDTRNLL